MQTGKLRQAVLHGGALPALLEAFILPAVGATVDGLGLAMYSLVRQEAGRAGAMLAALAEDGTREAASGSTAIHAAMVEAGSLAALISFVPNSATYAGSIIQALAALRHSSAGVQQQLVAAGVIPAVLQCLQQCGRLFSEIAAKRLDMTSVVAVQSLKNAKAALALLDEFAHASPESRAAVLAAGAVGILKEDARFAEPAVLAMEPLRQAAGRLVAELSSRKRWAARQERQQAAPAAGADAAAAAAAADAVMVALLAEEDQAEKQREERAAAKAAKQHRQKAARRAAEQGRRAAEHVEKGAEAMQPTSSVAGPPAAAEAAEAAQPHAAMAAPPAYCHGSRPQPA